MKCHQHTNGEMPVHDHPYANGKNRRVGQLLHQHRKAGEYTLLPCFFHRGLEDRRLVPGPALKKAVFRAGSLDGFDHVDTGQRGCAELALIPHSDTGGLYAKPRSHLGDDQVQQDCRTAHSGQNIAVADHGNQIKNQQQNLNQYRGQLGNQGLGNVVVQLLSAGQFTRQSLREKAHGQVQNMPHEIGIGHNGQFPLDFIKIKLFDDIGSHHEQ